MVEQWTGSDNNERAFSSFSSLPPHNPHVSCLFIFVVFPDKGQILAQRPRFSGTGYPAIDVTPGSDCPRGSTEFPGKNKTIKYQLDSFGWW